MSKLRIFAVFLFATSSFLVTNQAIATHASSCSLNADGEITDSAPSGGNTYCFPDFQEARVTFTKILVCPSEPTRTDYLTKCLPLFENDAGVKVTLSSAVDFPMPSNGPMSVSTGTYTHLVMVINGFIESKFTVTFDSARKGSGSTDGTTCYTEGNEEVWKSGFNFAHTNVICDTVANANPGFSFEYSLYCPGGTNRTNTKDWTADPGTGAERASYWVENDGVTLQNYSSSTCPSGPLSSVGEATFQPAPKHLNFQKLAVPLVITPSTSTIEFSFDSSGAGLVKQTKNGTCSFAGGCVTALRSKAPEFSITAR